MDEESSLGGDIAAAMTAGGDSPSPETSTPETTAAPASADATVPPADQPQTAKVGVPPEDRWPSILDNARNEWKQQYGWAEGVDPNQLQKSMEFYAQYESAKDPVEFLQQMAKRLQADPVHGPKLTSFAARALAQARGQGQPSEAPNLNDVIVDLGNGQQLPLSALSTQIREQMMRELSPQLAELKTLADQREQATADAFGHSAFEQLKSLPNFEEHKADIAARLGRMSLPADASPELVMLAAKAAYAEVVPAKLHASRLQTGIQAQQAKAQVNTVNPSTPSAGTPKDYRDLSWKEAFEHEMAARR